MEKKTGNKIVSQNSPAKGRQLEFFPIPTEFQKPQKPQISSVPGVSPKERNRYQVVIGDRVIATHIDSDTAWEIAANCTGAAEVDA